MSNTKAQVEDKVGNPIKEGDEVYTKMRGGKHEGTVRSLRYGLQRSWADRAPRSTEL